MATIVQPYNPWREQLAASILGPLVGNMIQKGQEAEQNRKRNAMLAAWTDANAVQDPLTGGAISTTPDPLAKQDFTTSFDRDLRPWANSLVDNGGLPQMGMSMAAPAQPQAPTLTSLFQLGGTKRFGGVNMDTVMPFAKELLAEQEAQRQRAAAAQRQAEMGQFLEGMRNIEGWDPYMRAMSEYVLRGYGGADALKEMSDYALGRQMSPYQAGQLANTQYKNEADLLLGREQNEIDRYKANSQNAHYERSDALGRDTLEQEQLYKMLDFKHRQMIDNWKLEHPKQELHLVDTGDGIQAIAWDEVNGKSTNLFQIKKGMSPKDAAAAQNKGAVTDQDIFAMKGKQIDAQLKSLDAREAAVRRGQVDIHGELTEAGKEELKQIAAERERALQKQDNLYHQRRGVLFPGDVPPDAASQDIANEVLTGIPNGIVSGDDVRAQPVDPSGQEKPVYRNKRTGQVLTDADIQKLIEGIGQHPQLNEAGVKNRLDLLGFLRRNDYEVIGQ